MLRATLARRGVAPSLLAEVRAALREAACQRAAPPELYVTYDASAAASERRQWTRLLDVAEAGGGALPQTQGVYVLGTADEADAGLRAPRASAMIGLPPLATADAARRFLDHFGAQLEGLRLAAVTHTQPHDGVVLAALRERFPQLRVTLSPFGRAFLTDPTFFSAASAAMAASDPRLAAPAFAGLDPDDPALLTPADGERLPLTHAGPADGAPRGRHLRVHHGPDPAASASPAAAPRRPLPPHYADRPLFFLDSAFGALHVGSQAVWRAPWLPHLARETGRAALLPVPPPLCLRGRPAAGVMGGAVLLVRPYEPLAAAEAAAAVVEAVPDAESVLSNTFGELPGDAAEVAAELREAGRRLEGLRSRLARRVATDTARDGGRWEPQMRERVLTDVLFRHDAAPPTAPARRAALCDWAEAELPGRLAGCLVQSAFALPPTEGTDSAARSSSSSSNTNTAGNEDGEHEQRHSAADELSGAAGVRLLCLALERKGMRGLGAAAERAAVDVRTFLEMPPAALQRTFKATAAVTRRLEALQQELRTKIKSAAAH